MCTILFKRSKYFLRYINFNHILLRDRLLQNLATSEVNSDDKLKEKVIYSSRHPKPSFLQTKRNEKALRKKLFHMYEKPPSIFLQYLVDKGETKEECSISQKELVEHPIEFPYSKNIIGINDIEEPREGIVTKNSFQEEHLLPRNVSVKEYFREIFGDGYTKSSKNWMNDYEKFSGEEELGDGIDDWKLDYGTSDPSIPVSTVPCGGCGAVLHCQDSSIPGFLPQEIFTECTNKDLRALKCQRCHFLENYSTALSVTVDANYYPTLLSRIKDEKAMVILLVDLTDFPSSLWPGILDILGHRRPLFLVGNKVDLLWGDKTRWMERVKTWLRSALPHSANVKYVSLISAKTGFGVEELISQLHTVWQYKGDVYLIGSTNVGKSTLFNLLLQSDYCKVKAVDLIQRATTAPWPGTTLNLLKFPILRPEGWRLYLRAKRLQAENKVNRAEKKLADEQRRAFKLKQVQPKIIGHIGRTFNKRLNLGQESREEAKVDVFSVPNRQELREATVEGSGLDPNDPDFLQSKWLYDTPGALHQHQILDLLTTEEVVATLPKTIIEPRTYLMKPGWTIFIAGLARLDYVQGVESVRLTVFASGRLPVTICHTVEAETLYHVLLRSDYFIVPQPNEKRLEIWPNLQSGPTITLCGISSEESCADILLSSAGWIAVTPAEKKICKFIPWTPHQRGIHVRSPPLLPFAVSLRGKKIPKAPAYSRSKICS